MKEERLGELCFLKLGQREFALVGNREEKDPFFSLMGFFLRILKMIV
jgi:hypothetical protein